MSIAIALNCALQFATSLCKSSRQLIRWTGDNCDAVFGVDIADGLKTLGKWQTVASYDSVMCVLWLPGLSIEMFMLPHYEFTLSLKPLIAAGAMARDDYDLLFKSEFTHTHTCTHTTSNHLHCNKTHPHSCTNWWLWCGQVQPPLKIHQRWILPWVSDNSRGGVCHSKCWSWWKVHQSTDLGHRQARECVYDTASSEYIVVLKFPLAKLGGNLFFL